MEKIQPRTIEVTPTYSIKVTHEYGDNFAYRIQKNGKSMPGESYGAEDRARRAINKKVAREAHSVELAKARAARAETRESCQICEGNWAMVRGLVSKHGYTRPGCGWLVGGCMGAQELPYSKSCEVLKHYLGAVEAWRTSAAERLMTAQRARSFTRQEYDYSKPLSNAEIGRSGKHYAQVPVTYKKGDVNFPRIRNLFIVQIETEVKHADEEITRVEKRIADWRLR